jgi:DNA-binding beta-propeller fold protein YncE/mono/diheme cytochrome c family protein
MSAPLISPRPLAFLLLALPNLAPPSAQAQTQVTGASAIPQRPQVAKPRARRPEEIFRANCATCHEIQGEGGVSWIDTSRIAPDIAGDEPFLIEHRVRGGRVPAMPAFPAQEISALELSALARYVNELPASYVPEPAYQATVTILDEDPWFSPMQITIQPGETVRFVNSGDTYHPVLDLAFMESGGERGTSSGLIGPGGVYFRRFPRRGTTTLLCGIHPYMRGEIHVGQGFTPPGYAVDPPAALPSLAGVGEVWVCAQFQDWPGKAEDGVIQVIDAATWSVTHTIPAGNNPHNLWFGAGSAQAVVTSWFDNVVTRIDTATKSVVGGDCIVGASPAHVTSDPSGTYWYFTVEGTHYVRRFTQAGGPYGLCQPPLFTEVGWLGGYGPHGLWYGGGKLVSANSLDSTFSILDAATLLELACLPAGMMPMGASTDTAGTLAASGNMGASVSVYDLTSLTWIRDIPLAHGAIQVPFSPDDAYIFAANGDRVTVIDAALAADPVGCPDPAAAIVTEIPTGKGAHGIAFGPRAGGGTLAYVTHKFENYLSVIDVDSLVRAGDVPLVTSTTGKVSLAGATDTGGNGVAVWPNPYPWQ